MLAKAGIRDFHVTGVQTCALPISSMFSSVTLPVLVTVMVYSSTSPTALYAVVAASPLIDVSAFTSVKAGVCVPGVSTSPRSEERRVGRERAGPSRANQGKASQETI